MNKVKVNLASALSVTDSSDDLSGHVQSVSCIGHSCNDKCPAYDTEEGNCAVIYLRLGKMPKEKREMIVLRILNNCEITLE